MIKLKLTKLLALFICAFILITSLATVTAFAEETSSADVSSETSGEEGEEELTWEDIWKDVKQPAYTTTAFSSVKERILGRGEIEPMQLLTVNGGYAFYGDMLTGEMIFLKLKDETLTKDAILESGEIPAYKAFYCTNPYNAGAAKAIGAENSSDASEKEKLLSQIIIKYSENEKDSTLNSFTDGAARQQIVVKNIRGGVRVEYTIGRDEVIYLVPRLIKKEKLEALRDQIDANSLSARDAKTFFAFYLIKDLNDPTLSDKAKKEMENEFPITKQFAVYACDSTISTQEILRIEKLVKSYTDYDYDALDADHAETEYVSEDKAPPLFKLALEYKVEGKEITIRCNAGNIRFDNSLYKLSDVLVLPYGGAGDVNNSGYLFSPDGSGSLIDFSDLSGQITNASSMYGQDYAYHTISGQNSEVVRLPVFGVYQRVEKDSKREETVAVTDENGDPKYDADGNPITEKVIVDVPLEIAYLAVIEEGDSLAKINVNYGGPLHNFASIYTSFNPRPKDSYLLEGSLSVGTNSMWTVESKRKYTGDFKLRLFILDGTEDEDVAEEGFDADKSYSDMAGAYRKYLEDTKVLNTDDISNADNSVPLYLETLGALETTKTVLGVPVDTVIALTSYQDTMNIITELSDTYGINDIRIKMNGWSNGGLMGDIATSIEVEKALGGEDGFNALVEHAKKYNVTLFPDVELSFAYRDNNFDGFDAKEDISETIDERSARKQVYDPVWQGFITVTPGEAIISPSFMKELYSGAYEDYSKLNVGAISVGSLGQYLSSDFDPDNPLTREDSKELVTQLLATIKEQNSKVLVTAGNKYTLPYATDIIEVPLDDSRLLISYASVPFMSMVLHGYKNYAGCALNLAGDYDYYLLKTIESGASPYFVVAANNTSELKQYNYSAVEVYYSVRYNIWIDDIVASYKDINEAIGDVQKAKMIKHDILTSDGKVAKVKYDNGVEFYVNYGEKDYAVKDTDIVVPVYGYVKLVNGEVTKVWEGK